MSNEFAWFDALAESIDKEKAEAYFEKLENKKHPQFKANIKTHKILQDFILNGGFEL